jgi:hypothetical protein
MIAYCGKIISVFFLGSFELWAAVPVGLAMALSPVIVVLTTSAGGIAGAVAVIFLSDGLRERLFKRYSGNSGHRRTGLIKKIWDRYGAVGLGLLAPLLTGVPLGVGIGMAFGAPAGKLLRWSSVGTILWTIGLTVAGVGGRSGIRYFFG